MLRAWQGLPFPFLKRADLIVYTESRFLGQESILPDFRANR